MEITKPLPLKISDADIHPDTLRALKDHLRETRLLGEDHTIPKGLSDLLPSIIAKRLEEIVPKDFELSEIELKFSIDGKPMGFGVGGEVVATLKRKNANTGAGG